MNLEIRKARGDIEMAATADPVGASNPATESVTLQVGNFRRTIAPGGFVLRLGTWTYTGTIGTTKVRIVISGANRTGVHTIGASIERAAGMATTTTNPVPVTLTVGDESFAASATARLR